MALNSVVLMGRLTADPEIRTTTSGLAVTRICLAVDRKYQQGQEKKADFIDVVAWRGTAEFIGRYFRKGSMIGIEGELQTSSYTDKDGKNRKSTEVIASNVSFCESKSSSEGQQAGAGMPAYPSSTQFEEISADDTLPF